MMLQLECSNRTEGPPPVTLYPLLVIIMAVILFLLLLTSLSFTISYRYTSYKCAILEQSVDITILFCFRWRRESNLHRPLEPQTKAYTITLCSNQSLDKAT